MLDCTTSNGIYHMYHTINKCSFYCDNKGNQVPCPTHCSLWDSVEPIPTVIYESAMEYWESMNELSN